MVDLTKTSLFNCIEGTLRNQTVILSEVGGSTAGTPRLFFAPLFQKSTDCAAHGQTDEYANRLRRWSPDQEQDYNSGNTADQSVERVFQNCVYGSPLFYLMLG